ncbi:MAG: ArgR family transcriptional regulator [Spirochaetales bacterium]|nr:ArgR family transcriptional regulator [Spirochaetales bacterium]
METENHIHYTMNQKTQRLATIRKIIRSEMIGSQEELIARLDECGIKITQSTLSRDLKFMNVAKVPHKNKGYIYVLPNAAQHESNISSNISDNITSLTFSGNLGVLKTKSGYASAISVPIDNIDCPAILDNVKLPHKKPLRKSAWHFYTGPAPDNNMAAPFLSLRHSYNIQ